MEVLTQERTLEDRLEKLPELRALIKNAKSVTIAESAEHLAEIACGGADKDYHEVTYTLPDGREVLEAKVVRTKNGISANYVEPYMRRRDPKCMLIADDKPTDKKRFSERFDFPFSDLREETFEWLEQQDLGLFFFHAGQRGKGYDGVAVIPANAGFFGLGLALLQGILDPNDLPEDFEPSAAIYVAPPFRHTHFDGKQIVVHNREDERYEMFSYNLYPGPSAKKGVYGMLIGLGEEEGWITAHCSTVKVTTPYDHRVTFMHEGASGGGKSEMLQQPHRLPNGRLLLGRSIVTGEERTLPLPQTCDLRPVTDDMALCHPSLQKDDGKLWLEDAEDAWFIRVDHIKKYGTDMELERQTAMSKEPLLFLNIDAVPGGRAMIWEHTMDAPDTPCPNPRVILPRRAVNDIINEPVSVDVRSIGLRTPPCTRENPTYGIIGVFHVIPPALAWLWRLVAPRGYANPSIIQTEGISSEGVGSYWPFATGKKVNQANLLLRQIQNTPNVEYILTPNQHLGAWECSFMPQWITREYLARRGGTKYPQDRLEPSRCALLGYTPKTMKVEGIDIPRMFMKVYRQEEMGKEAYDKGAEILYEFFGKMLSQFNTPELDPLGRKIIDSCLNRASADELRALL